MASSSAGNSAFIGTSRTRLLIDAGLSRREIAQRLALIGEELSAIDAILITHEHSDHTCGLASLVRHDALAKRAQSAPCMPIYVTRQTGESIDWGEFYSRNGSLPLRPALAHFQAGCSFCVGDFTISSFTVPHDAIDPVGYTLTAEGTKVGIATDLGYIPDSLRVHLKGTNLLLLESNHDIEMLRVGPYPWSVKQRVMSRRGHLSNEVAADFIERDLDGSVSTLVLGHISEHNNHPELVRRMGDKALAGRTLFTKLVVAQPGVQSEVFCY